MAVGSRVTTRIWSISAVRGSGPTLLLQATGLSETPDGWESLSDNHKRAQSCRADAQGNRASSKYRGLVIAGKPRVPEEVAPRLRPEGWKGLRRQR